METSSSKKTGLILGAVVLAVVVCVNLLRRHVDAQAAPARPRVASARPEVVSPSRVAVPSSVESRRARDAMRAEILEAMRRRAAASPVAASPAAPRAVASAPAAAGDEPRGHYEPSYIREHFREDMFPLLRQCYEGALERRPKLAGKLVLGFDIVGDPSVGGIVEEASFAEGSTLQDPEMETCVRESLMTLTFDKPPTGGGRVSVKYPVEFAPEGEEPDGGAASAGTDGGTSGREAADGGRR
ncbi:Hypothetical protein A7982_02746 [Minicystis rosea]|nr:Hypothetical protein A7982_02746 [Minicystis rosea]